MALLCGCLAVYLPQYLSFVNLSTFIYKFNVIHAIFKLFMKRVHGMYLFGLSILDIANINFFEKKVTCMLIFFNFFFFRKPNQYLTTFFCLL